MLGRSPGRTPGVLSNGTAVPVRLLSRASPHPDPPPSSAHGHVRPPGGMERFPSPRGGGSGWGIAQRQQPPGRLANESSPTRAPTQPFPTGGGLSDTGGGSSSGR